MKNLYLWVRDSAPWRTQLGAGLVSNHDISGEFSLYYSMANAWQNTAKATAAR